MAANEVVNGKNTQLQSGKYDPTSGFYIQDSTGRAVAVRDANTGRLLSQDEEADYVRNNKALNTTWEQIKQAQPEAPPPPSSDAPVPVSPTPTPTPTPTGDPSPTGGGAPAVQGLYKAMGQTAAGWADEPMRDTSSQLGARTLPMAVTTLSDVMRRFGRTY